MIDLKTLYLMNLVVAVVAAGASYLCWYNDKTSRGLRGWAIGLTLGGIGSFMLSLRDPDSGFASLVAADTLIVGGYAVVWASLRRFNDGRRELRRVFFVVAIFATTFTLAGLLSPDTRIRIAVVSCFIGSLALSSGWEILQGGRYDPLRTRLPTAAGFGVMGATMLLRAVLAAASAPLEIDSPSFDPTNGYALFTNTVCLLVVTLGLVMMANDRLRSQYQQLAVTDALTGLSNRRCFMENGERLAARAAANRTPTCLVMIDLDYFSDINRRFGHAGGDLALKAFAKCALANVRPGDLVGRYGGEEFCILLKEATLETGMLVAERLRASVAELALTTHGKILTFSVSIGVAMLQDGELQEGLHEADIALYCAKQQGRNRVNCEAAIPFSAVRESIAA